MNSSITISLCMIVRNEQQTLSRCLECVKDVVDEIIIVDTGSTDSTKEIALRYTTQVIDFAWQDDFAAARNTSFSYASKDYILWLDADDYLPESERAKLLALKSTLDPRVDCVSMNYHLLFDEQGNPSFSLKRHRLVKRAKNFHWIGYVHEYLEVQGVIYHSDINIVHRKESTTLSDRNLKIYTKMLATGVPFTPRDLFYYANELYDHCRLAEAAHYYHKFLDCKQGWYEDNIFACGRLADYYSRVTDDEQKLRYIFKTFEFDRPRADACCRLGYHFLSREMYASAVFWYKLAAQLEPPQNAMGLSNHACWTWLPHVQLTVCYYRLGDDESARKHHSIAEGLVPNSPHVLNNKKLFFT